jgi:hypothetical protein
MGLWQIERYHEGPGRGGWVVNVEFSAFHEGRGARKKDPVGGHDLVNRKRIVREKER